jgi:hypothetical protein
LRLKIIEELRISSCLDKKNLAVDAVEQCAEKEHVEAHQLRQEGAWEASAGVTPAAAKCSQSQHSSLRSKRGEKFILVH